MPTRARSCSCIFLLMALLIPASAQLPTSTLNGSVTDPQGAVAAGASVTATHVATGRAQTTTTTSDGSFAFTNLQPGQYTVAVSAPGFAERSYPVHLEVGRATTLKVQLALAKVGEQVEVTAAPVEVNLTQSQVQGIITSETVENIPLNGRNFLELAYLIPGNRPAANFDPTKTNTLEVSSAGSFGRGGNITVDGADNNDEVVGGTLMNFPQDAVQEFQIATNRFSAEVGRSGSSIVNIITKGGTNSYHGSAFFFYRGDEIQGLPATFDRSRPEPPFDREQFGGSIGGPIARDRVFWFTALEYRNQDAVAEVGERDFAARRVITTSSPAPLDDFLLSSRVDFAVSDNDRLFLRYAYNNAEDVAPGSLAALIGTAANRQLSQNTYHSGVVDWTSTRSATLVNSLALHINLFKNNIPTFPENAPITDPAGLAVGNELRFGSELQEGANFRIPQGVDMNRFQIRDNVSWKVGSHTVRFGGEYQHIGNNAVFDLFGSGSIFLAETFGAEDRNNDGVVNDLDIPIVFTLGSAAPVRPPFVPFYRTNYFGLYFQDDWRATSNLTLNLGLRWDWDSNVLAEGDAHKPCPDLTATPDTRCVWIRNVLGPHDSSASWKNFGPRLGFAWDPFGRGTTVFRGGYGIYYDRVVTEVNLLELLLDGRILPLAITGGSTCGGDANCDPGEDFDPGTPTLADPFSGGATVFGIGINVIDNDAAHPYTQQFNLGLDHRLGQNWVISADGIHNFAQRQLIGRLLRNSPISDPLLTCPDPVTPCTVTDPLTGRTDRITVIGSFAKAWFSGLVTSLRKAPSKIGAVDWSFNLNYTLSKSLDFANDDQIPFNTETQADILFGTDDLSLEKGHSLTDERHRLSFYGVFDFPWDISLSPIWTFGSGVPMDTFVPGLNSRLPSLPRNALGREIKNVGELNAAITAWNNLPACVPGGGVVPCNVGGALPLVGLPDDTTFGDTFNALDLRLTKSFRITEAQRLQLIGEVFNLFNVTNIRGFNNRNFSGFNNDITSTTFNTPVRTAGGFFGSGGPRAFQFAVRYTF